MSRRSSQEKITILLAEDNPADVFLICESLKEHGVEFAMELVESGEQAMARLDQLKDGSSGLPPDVVVLDLNLPQIDGTELLRHLRDIPRLAELPVVIFTSSDSPQDRQNAAMLGAMYIRKPVNLDEFMKIGQELKRLAVRA
jgi:chemotaxis family two-component system response regulator Rcp1